MWERKQAPSPTKAAMPATAQPVSPPDTAQPPGLRTAVKPAADADRSERDQEQTTQISTGIRIKGEVVADNDIYVDGEIEGTVVVPDNALTIGPNGMVRAKLKARSVTIWGHLEGNVQVGEKIELRKTATLIGDLVTARIAIEDGAVLRGNIVTSKPEKDEQAPPRESKPPPSSPSVGAPAVPARPSGATDSPAKQGGQDAEI